MKKLLMIALLATLGLPFAAQAQTPPPPVPPRTITVSGESKADFPPDQAILSLSLVSRDKSLAVAKKQNDALAGKLLAITNRLGIPKEKIATSSIDISPQYSYDKGEQHFTDYVISRSLRITMDNLDLPEKLLSAVVDAGVDQVNGLEYGLADPEKYAGPLRVKAFKDAETKAKALATAAGDTLGKALTISAGGGNFVPPPRPMSMLAAVRAEPSVAPSLPGMVSLQEAVNVTFELK